MDGWLDRLMIATTTIANIYRHESLATLKNLLAKVEKINVKIKKWKKAQKKSGALCHEAHVMNTWKTC